MSELVYLHGENYDEVDEDELDTYCEEVAMERNGQVR